MIEYFAFLGFIFIARLNFYEHLDAKESDS